MSTIVVGNIRMANGMVPSLRTWHEGQIAPTVPDNLFIRYSCSIRNGSFLVEFPEEMPYHIDDIFTTAMNVINNTVLSIVAEQGIGLSPTIGYCKMQSGEIKPFVPAAVRPDKTLNGDNIRAMMGSVPAFRDAVADYNRALLHTEDCPFFFYRFIETLARVVCNKGADDRVAREDWDKFHSKLGTSRSDLAILMELAGKHRHGNRVVFDSEQQQAMMRTARLFMLAFVEWYVQEGPRPEEVYQKMKGRAEAGQ